MKNIILLCLSMAALASFAQTSKTSGTINNPAVKEVYLFLPEGDTYFESASVRIPVSPNAEQPGDREKIYARLDKVL
jgi:hypothetical protein